jgi:hypothetical protein
VKKKKKRKAGPGASSPANKEKLGEKNFLNEPGPEDIETGDEYFHKNGMSVTVRADIETAFERGLLYAAVIFILIAALIIIMTHEGPKARNLLIYLPVPAGLSALAFYCRLKIKNYYLIDPIHKKIYFICNFFGNEHVSLFARSEDLIALGVSGEKYRGDDFSSWLEYSLVAVDGRGKITRLSASSGSGRRMFNEKASEFAKSIGCASVKCPDKCGLRTRETPDGSHEIYFEEIRVSHPST